MSKKNKLDFKGVSMPKGSEVLKFDLFEPKKGEPLISIRQFYKTLEGEEKPGRQGLTLRLDEIPLFVNKLREAFEALKELHNKE